MKVRVGFIFGGESVEHEVSVISALQAMSNIDTSKYEAVPIYISKNKVWYTGDILKDINNYKDLEDLCDNAKEVVLCKIENEFCLTQVNTLFNKIIKTIDIAFPIVHGQNVEDGTLAGFLDTVGIPYVGSKVLGASLGQDKVVMKQIFEASNIPCVNYVWFYDNEYLLDEDKYLKEIKKLGYPVVVKPASLGSSVGITFVKDEKEIVGAIKDATEYDTKIIVEKAVNNMIEVNCSVCGNYEIEETSEIEEVLSDNSILTYNDKYVGSGKTKGSKKSSGMVNTSRIIPARISKNLKEEVIDISKKCFKALNLSGVVRIDFLIDSKEEKVYVNEPNTIPGSLAFYLWEPIGKSYSLLLDNLITMAIKEYKNKQNKKNHFDTNILKNMDKNFGIKK